MTRRDSPLQARCTSASDRQKCDRQTALLSKASEAGGVSPLTVSEMTITEPPSSPRVLWASESAAGRSSPRLWHDFGTDLSRHRRHNRSVTRGRQDQVRRPGVSDQTERLSFACVGKVRHLQPRSLHTTRYQMVPFIDSPAFNTIITGTGSSANGEGSGRQVGPAAATTAIKQAISHPTSRDMTRDGLSVASHRHRLE